MEKQYLGMLISIEGIDGSGKSTLARLLHEQIQNNGFNVLLTHQPGATELGKHLRAILHERPFDICSKAEFLLFACDRAQHIAQVIEPALQKNSIVISDRMADSSLAYQGFGRGLDKQFISSVNSWAMNERVPDLTIYLKVDYETACKRLVERNKELTSFEKEKAAFFEQVIKGFETIFKERSNVITIDGSKPIDAVQAQALESILSQISKYNISKSL